MEPLTYWKIPAVWTGETVVCIASGPSLDVYDVLHVRGRARAIVVNRSYRMAPWADALYSGDRAFWEQEYHARNFAGERITIDAVSAKSYGLRLVRQIGCSGLSIEQDRICHGRNSGYQAVNVAMLYGARRIVLLGYDMRHTKTGRVHWHEPNPDRNPTSESLETWAGIFATMLPTLEESGVEVVNCTPGSAITAFPKADLKAVLP